MAKNSSLLIIAACLAGGYFLLRKPQTDQEGIEMPGFIPRSIPEINIGLESGPDGSEGILGIFTNLFGELTGRMEAGELRQDIQSQLSSALFDIQLAGMKNMFENAVNSISLPGVTGGLSFPELPSGFNLPEFSIPNLPDLLPSSKSTDADKSASEGIGFGEGLANFMKEMSVMEWLTGWDFSHLGKGDTRNETELDKKTLGTALEIVIPEGAPLYIDRESFWNNKYYLGRTEISKTQLENLLQTQKYAFEDIIEGSPSQSEAGYDSAAAGYSDPGSSWYGASM